MKHNELKSYIKNKIKQAVAEQGYDIVGIDETNSTKRFLIIDKESMLVQGIIRLFVNVEQFSVRYINAPHLKKNKNFNFLADSDTSVEGYNTDLHLVNQFITVLKRYMSELNIMEMCK